MPCSYCRISGHQINWCNSRDINRIYRRIETIYNNLPVRMNFQRLVDDNFTLRELKVICVSRLHRPASLRKENYILILWNHFNRERSLIPNGPDDLPLWANDVETENEDVLFNWRIDRTPTTPIIDIQPIDILNFQNYDDSTEFERYYQLIDIALSLEPIFNQVQLQTEKKFDIVRETSSELLEREKNQCSICFEDVEKQKFIRLNCAHEFCGDCIINTLKSKQHKNMRNGIPCCAFCRTNFTKFTISDNQLNEELDLYCLH